MTFTTLQNPYPQLGFIPFTKTPNFPAPHFLDVPKKPKKPTFIKASSSMVIDKEQDFKPSFDEYLKALETVKIRREKRQNSGESPAPEMVPVPESESGEKGGELGDTHLELGVKKVWVRKKVDNGVVKTDENEVVKKWVRKKSDSGYKGSEKDTNVFRRNEEKYEMSHVMDKEKDANVFRKVEDKYDKYQGERIKGLEVSYAMNKERAVNVKKVSGRREFGGYGNVEMERDAFKSLEEHPDVCDQPRVSRAEMEERIQKLAKCLNGASIDSPEWNFSKMMRSAKIRFADFSIIRLIQILGNYGNWRQVLQVIEWMQARERFKSNRIRNIYTAALDALGKAKRPVESLNVFNTMLQQMASYPDRIAYHCIAVTLGQAGHMRELFHVIDTMRSPPKKKLSTGVYTKWDPRLEPDIIVYNSVLNACVRQKNLEGAFWVLQQLKEQGKQPNSITYGLVMEVMLACEKYDLVHEFFQKMRKSFIPNSLTYKVLVNTLWKEGKVDEAIQTVQYMEKRGIVGSAAVYYDLARCLCSAGRCKEALVQVKKVCKVANKPLVVTYTGLIQASLDSGKIDSGTYIFDHMRKFCSPNLVTYNIMLKGYLDHHKFDEARQLFYKLLENGKHITSTVDYRQAVLPDIHTFNLMLDACLMNQKWDDLEFVYRRMLEHGFYFNAKRHSHMILEACNAGKQIYLLETTWKHLIEGDQIPPPPLVQEMFCIKLKEDDYTAAFSCLICLPSTESHKYSRNSWLIRFRDNPDVFREETLLRIIDRTNTLLLRNEEINPILLNLMRSCKEILGVRQ
ncbi:tetratricopeptide-like helical domain-containing protein [Artemisia annua]|uniref:Tetratricopeptide-like helical domain-containing protein n=1 Tax=Artemisia annua TaxID=35608 RepID=A0A2U1L630_ARTAN|nr:tetratricopeptide-like helical domain-containing protein [Artemisia annua]